MLPHITHTDCVTNVRRSLTPEMAIIALGPRMYNKLIDHEGGLHYIRLYDDNQGILHAYSVEA